MRMLLGALVSALEVRPSTSHGRNDCLTDSILLSMEDQGLIGPLSIQARAQLCIVVRNYLERNCGLCTRNYPFLSHDNHFADICHVLRQSLLPHWRGEQSLVQTSLTCIVYDRFNRQLRGDAMGGEH